MLTQLITKLLISDLMRMLSLPKRTLLIKKSSRNINGSQSKMRMVPGLSQKLLTMTHTLTVLLFRLINLFNLILCAPLLVALMHLLVPNLPSQ
jgi:hypothetical protein